MRTTVILPDALAEQARQAAAEQGRTFTSLVEQGLRHVLTLTDDRATLDLPTHGGDGRRVLIDLGDHDALWTALDADAAT